MSSWRTICCAVDLSEASRLAMERAAALAKDLDAELVLLHAYEAPTPAVTGMLLSPPELFAAAEEEVRRALNTWRQKAERLAGRSVTVRVVPGAAAAEIVRFAAEEHVDALVLGTHGRTGIRRLLLGSVAQRVVTEASCPVVVVGKPRAPRPPPVRT